MTLQNLQEDLVKLFLRLNGYFTTGLIIHSPNYGHNKTELDIVAVRLPFHSQPDRVVECSKYLQIPEKTIDIIIGEVKSGSEPIQINPALREDRSSIEKLLQWVEAFDKEEIDLSVDSLQCAMATQKINTPDAFKCVNVYSKSGNYSIRPATELICIGAESFLAGTASCRIQVEGIEELFEEYKKQGVLHSPNTKAEEQHWGNKEFHAVDNHRNLLSFYDEIILKSFHFAKNPFSYSLHL